MQIKEENNRFALYNDENQEIGEMTWSDAEVWLGRSAP